MMSEPIGPAVGGLEELRAALERLANEEFDVDAVRAKLERLANEESDLDALRGALERVANEEMEESVRASELGPELALQDIVRAAYNGPRTLATARALLASPRARRGLTRYWAENCPPPEVIDATVASPTAPEEEKALARATYELITTLHADTCANCRERLNALTREIRRLEDPDLVIRQWTLTAHPKRPHGALQAHTPQLADVRGETPRHQSGDTAPAASHTFTVTDPTLCAVLTARPIAQPQDITLHVDYEVTSQRATVTLLVPGGLSREVASVSVVLGSTLRNRVRIPIDLGPRDDDDVEFTGTATFPPGALPILDTVDFEVD